MAASAHEGEVEGLNTQLNKARQAYKSLEGDLQQLREGMLNTQAESKQHKLAVAEWEERNAQLRRQ